MGGYHPPGVGITGTDPHSSCGYLRPRAQVCHCEPPQEAWQSVPPESNKSGTAGLITYSLLLITFLFACSKKENRLDFSSRFLVLALRIFLCRQRIVLPLKNSPGDCFRQKKAPTLRLRLCVGVTYLPVQSPAKYCRRRCA